MKSDILSNWLQFRLHNAEWINDKVPILAQNQLHLRKCLKNALEEKN